MSEALTRALRPHLSSEPTIVGSAREFVQLPREAQAVAFLDSRALDALELAGDDLEPPSPIIAICDEQLQTAVSWLPTRPWLSHVVGVGLLNHPRFKEHLDNVAGTLSGGSQPKLLDWLGGTVAGRRIRLAQASKRFDRLERMCGYFEEQGVGGRTIEQLRDAAEELLTNAFYDAPVAAGRPR